MNDLVVFVPEISPKPDDVCFRIFKDGEIYFFEKFLYGNENSLSKFGYGHLYEALEACAKQMEMYSEIRYTTMITYLME
jgi:hypothetical protein